MAGETTNNSPRMEGQDQKNKQADLNRGREGTSQLLNRKNVVEGQPQERVHKTHQERKISLNEAQVAAAAAIKEKASNYVDSLRALIAENKGTPEMEIEIEVLSRVASVSLGEGGKIGEDVLVDLLAAGMFLGEEYQKDLEVQEEASRRLNPTARLELELKAAQEEEKKIEQETRNRLFKFLEGNNFSGRGDLFNKVKEGLSKGKPLSAQNILKESQTAFGSGEEDLKSQWGEIERDFSGQVQQCREKEGRLKAEIDRQKSTEPVLEAAEIAKKENEYERAKQEARDEKERALQLRKEVEEAEKKLNPLRAAEMELFRAELALQEAQKNEENKQKELGNATSTRDKLSEKYFGEEEKRINGAGESIKAVVDDLREANNTLEHTLEITAGEEEKNEINKKIVENGNLIAENQKKIADGKAYLLNLREEAVSLPEKISGLNDELQVAKARVEANTEAKNKAKEKVDSLKKDSLELEREINSKKDEIKKAEAKAGEKEIEADQIRQTLESQKNLAHQKEVAGRQIEGTRGRVTDIENETDVLIGALVDSRSLLDKTTMGPGERLLRGVGLAKVDQVRKWLKGKEKERKEERKREEAASREARALVEGVRERPLSTLMASYELKKQRDNLVSAPDDQEEQRKEPRAQEAQEARVEIVSAVKKLSELSKEDKAQMEKEVKEAESGENQDEVLQKWADKLGVGVGLLAMIFLLMGQVQKAVENK